MDYWANFLTSVAAARTQLRCSESGTWYRGVSNAEYPLIPKLFRSKYKPDAEANIYRSYLRTRHANHNPAHSWTNVIDMAHIGTPTRLLDWTESFGVALWFALNPTVSSKPVSPCIWILNPYSLACRARGNNDKSIGDFHISPDHEYYKSFVTRKDWPYKYPMPFFAPTPNERIRAQRGFFTVHGNDSKPLNQTCAKHAICVPIDLRAVDSAKEFLSLAGIDDASIYPDEAGWLRYVERMYCYSLDDQIESET